MAATTVLVTGARGKTGREVVSRLRGEVDVAVRAGTSQPTAGPGEDAVRPVPFDWHDPATWPDAVSGADAIFLMRPDLPDAPDLISKLVELSPDSRVVLLSEQGAEKLGDDHWARRAEDAVINHARTWTILRASWFHQDLTDPRFYRDSVRNDRVFALPSGGTPIAWVDARDVAEVATAALLSDGREHSGRAYTITGPEQVTVSAIAQLLSEHTAEPVQPVDPVVAGALQGLDPWATDIVSDLYQRVQKGEFGELSSDVEEVTGHKPRAIADFIREHRDEWIR